MPAPADDLAEQVRWLLEQNQALESRVSDLESRLAAPAPQAELPASPKLARRSEKQSTGLFLTTRTTESDIGLKWFARLGILMLVIGMGFFIKSALEYNWISHTLRLLLGLLAGIGLLVTGELVITRQRYDYWGKTLIGGGLALLYFVVYAAYKFPAYRQALGMSQALDIFLLSLVVLLSMGLAFRHNSRVIASGSFFLGFNTSLLGGDFEFLTLVYELLLTVGLVATVIYKRWPEIGMGGALASYALYIFWFIRNQDEFAVGLAVLVLYFMLYTTQSLFLRSQTDERQNRQALASAIFNAVLFFGLAQWLLTLHPQETAVSLGALGLYFALYTLQVFLLAEPDSRQLQRHSAVLAVLNTFCFSWLTLRYFGHQAPQATGWLLLGLAGGHLVLKSLAHFRRQDMLAQAYLYGTLAFITLAIPEFAPPDWVGALWALEAAGLVGLALGTGLRAFRYSAYVLGLVLLAHLIPGFWSGHWLHRLPSPLVFTGYLLTALAFYASALALQRCQARLAQWERIGPEIYAWAGTGVLLLALPLKAPGAWVTLLWVGLFLALAGLSFPAGIPGLRQAGYLVGLAVWLRVVRFDFGLEGPGRIGNAISGILALHLLSWYLESRRLPEVEREALPVWSWLGSLLAVLLIAHELKAWWISIGWAMLAFGLLVLGLLWQKAAFRFQCILLLGVTVAKVFLFDTRELDTAYRTLSFIILGLVLLAGSLVYTRYQDRLKRSPDRS